MRNKRRCSAAVAYLRPAMKRPNLRVVIRALAHRVLFDGRRAIGLEFAQDGVVRRVLARREVILAGGSINSPQLLQLSGVGPGELLREHGIPVVHDLPAVGENLQDHLEFPHGLPGAPRQHLERGIAQPAIAGPRRASNGRSGGAAR